MEEDGLRRGRLHRYPAVLLPVCAGLLDLGAAVGQAAADQPQLPDLYFNGGKLPLQKRQAAFGIVVLHMFPDLRQRKTDLLHDEDGVQKVDLVGAVVSVAVVRVHIGRAEQADFVIKNQRLFGNMLVL